MPRCQLHLDPAGSMKPGWRERMRPIPGFSPRETPDAPGHRDAFLGNGWMGQRFGVEGDASSYPVENRGDTTPSGCLVLGLWDDGAKLLAPPRSAVLEYHDHCSALASFFRKGEGKWNQYSQRLDLRTATLTTDVTWTSDSGRTTKLKTTAYLSRRPAQCRGD